jgi:hypothetical protein
MRRRLGHSLGRLVLAWLVPVVVVVAVAFLATRHG